MIARTYETKFLGVIIQANREWSTHIVQLKNKISKSIGIISNCTLEPLFRKLNILKIYDLCK